MNYDFRGRVVLVTGASSGIGRATAEAFARAGASVALTARSEERLSRIVQQLHPTEARIVAHHLDVTDRAEAFEVIEKVARELGQIDILVNNAGIGHCGRLDDFQHEDLQKVVDTNLMGVLHCTQAVIPIMKAQGKGQIVNVCSTVGYKGIPLLSVYCATKFAVRGLSESLRMELAQNGVEVICVSPGTTDTEFFDRAATYEKGWWRKRAVVAKPESVAERILYACAQHKREVVLTIEGKAMVMVNKLAPRFVDYMTMKIATR